MKFNRNELARRLVDRTGVIQTLIAVNDYKSYLEIGCDCNQTFSRIRCELMVGVDPVKGGTHRMTSDEFFEQYDDKFDIIFIDGNHHHDQVAKDLENSLLRLNEGGIIVMHDCNPITPQLESQGKSGTAWRVYVTFRKRPDLDMIVCNFDRGIGLVRYGTNANILDVGRSFDELTFNDLETNRSVWMNLHGPVQIVEWMLQNVEEDA